MPLLERQVKAALLLLSVVLTVGAFPTSPASGFGAPATRATAAPARAVVTTRAAAATTSPCGTRTLDLVTPHRITHVVWVVFENKPLSLFQSAASSAPYLHQLASQCGLGTHYSSTPYDAAKLAMTSGTTWGVTTDASPEPGPDLYFQLGTNWREYMGGMTSNCQTTTVEQYYQRHNPATYFADAASACATQDVPLPADPTQIDLSAAFTWIEGDVTDSMHTCPTGCATTSVGQLAAGDAWASGVIPALTATPEYQAGTTAIFVVWDQGTTSDAITPLIVVSPYTRPGTVSTTAMTHYSLLRGTEQYLGLPLLGAAGNSSTTSVVGQIGLPTVAGLAGFPSTQILPPVIMKGPVG